MSIKQRTAALKNQQAVQDTAGSIIDTVLQATLAQDQMRLQTELLTNQSKMQFTQNLFNTYMSNRASYVAQGIKLNSTDVTQNLKEAIEIADWGNAKDVEKLHSDIQVASLDLIDEVGAWQEDILAGQYAFKQAQVEEELLFMQDEEKYAGYTDLADLPPELIDLDLFSLTPNEIEDMMQDETVASKIKSEYEFLFDDDGKIVYEASEGFRRGYQSGVVDNAYNQTLVNANLATMNSVNNIRAGEIELAAAEKSDAYRNFVNLIRPNLSVGRYTFDLMANSEGNTFINYVNGLENKDVFTEGGLHPEARIAIMNIFGAMRTGDQTLVNESIVGVVGDSYSLYGELKAAIGEHTVTPASKLFGLDVATVERALLQGEYEDEAPMLHDMAKVIKSYQSAGLLPRKPSQAPAYEAAYWSHVANTNATMDYIDRVVKDATKEERNAGLETAVTTGDLSALDSNEIRLAEQIYNQSSTPENINFDSGPYVSERYRYVDPNGIEHYVNITPRPLTEDMLGARAELIASQNGYQVWDSINESNKNQFKAMAREQLTEELADLRFSELHDIMTVIKRANLAGSITGGGAKDLGTISGYFDTDYTPTGEEEVISFDRPGYGIGMFDERRENRELAEQRQAGMMLGGY